MFSDHLLGGVLLGGAALTIVYYTVWVILLPFVEEDQDFILHWFPDRQYAIGLPLLAGVFGLIMIGVFVTVAMMKGKTKKKVN